MLNLRRLLLHVFIITIHKLLISSATLTINHGRVTFIAGQTPTVVVQEVEGVAALDLGSMTPINQYFDCTSTDGVTNLVWERDGGSVRFPMERRDDELRLNMAPDDGSGAVDYPDLDVYTCRDTVTGDGKCVNITGGSLAINPREAILETGLGGNISLQVYIAGNPSIISDEIMWYAPDGPRITSGKRLVLQNGNTRLFLEDIELADAGLYRIDIRRDMHATVTTSINLNIHVEPMVTLSPNSLLVVEHDSALLTCMFTGNPSPSISWERNDTNSLPVETRRSINSISMMNGTFINIYTVISEFEINNVLYEDEGSYRCVGSNILLVGQNPTTTTSGYAKLTITPRLVLDPVNFPIKQGGISHIPDNSAVEVHCTGSGTLSWHSSSGADIPVSTVLSPTINVFQRRDDFNNRQTLNIQSFTSADTAIYTCTTDLTITGNSIEESIFITNADPAVFISQGDEYADRGSNINFTAVIYSSNPNTLTVEWYLNGTFINTTSNARYSVNMDNMNRYVLSIMNVDTDILGEYTVLVDSEGRNESDSVQLTFPVPPSSTVSPSSHAVNEGESVQFQCQAAGTEPTIRWTLEGDEPLPNGVVQSGDNLVIGSATRSHAGNYDCIVINSAGATATSVAALTIFYAPTATITHEETGQPSMNQLLSVIAEQGDLAPTFSCASDGSPSPTLTWSVLGGSLPSGVVESPLPSRRVLTWNRILEYTDSGRYECTAQNSNGTSTATLDLLVRQPPIISSISPNSPVTSSSVSSFLVPEGNSGTILTCAAYSWPPPTIEWLRNGQALLDGRMRSDSTSNQNSAFVSARLRWTVGFEESDIGNYTCMVRANDTNAFQSKSVSLELTLPTTPGPNPVECSVSSSLTYFQIRIFDTECLFWNEVLKKHIRASFLTEIKNIIETECPECDFTAYIVEITEPPTCSDLIDRAAFFRGSISTPQIDKTKGLFCALNRWQESGPIVQINSRFHRVDSNCSLESGSLTSRECSPGPSPILTMEIIYIIAGAMGGVVVLLVLVFSVCLCCCCCFCCGRSGNKDLDQCSATNQSNYDRTYLSDNTRYTSRVGEVPDQRHLSQSDSMAKTPPPPIYSTLDRRQEVDQSITATSSSFSSPLPSQMSSYPPQLSPFAAPTSSFPPPPPFRGGEYNSQSFEMGLLRENSRAHMMAMSGGDVLDGEGGGGGGVGGVQFQLIQDTGRSAEPYQIAHSSTGNIERVGMGDPSVQQDHHGLTSGVTDPTIIYEQVDKNSASNSPFKTHPHGSDHGNKTHPQSSDLNRPLRTISSVGQIKGVVHQQEPGRSFKRHMSAIESTNSGHRNGHDDYSQLDRNEGRQGTTPPTPTTTAPVTIAATGIQKGRSKSLINAPPSLSHYPRSYHAEKRPSVTNYDRTMHPTSPGIRSTTAFSESSEAPPPYHDVPPGELPKLSASLTQSLMENTSYGESPRPHHDRRGNISHNDNDGGGGSGGVDEVFFPQWYHNASDFSLNESTTASESVGRETSNTIMPYSQVSSSEISNHRSSEGIAPRFSVSRNEPSLPVYPHRSSTTRSSGGGGVGGNLMRGIPPNTRFQTVLV